MIIEELTTFIEDKFPLSQQESYDNCGLIVGDPKKTVKKVLLALDCTEQVIKEAKLKKADVIITHHPLMFSSINKLTANDYEGSLIIKLIKSDIALYAVHTNLDNSINGINKYLALKLGLKNLQILVGKEKTFKKIITFVPKAYSQKVITALSAAKAGNIGLYSHCAFVTEGSGCFKPEKGAKPFLGELSKINQVEEVKLEMVFASENQKMIENSLKKAHPYEQPAFDIIELANPNPDIGAGIYGDLPAQINTAEFLKLVKTKLNLSYIRQSNSAKKFISKVAICSGAGFFVFEQAKRLNVDALVTSEIKHHEFLAAENNILLCDIDHHEGEIAAVNILDQILQKLENIDTLISKHNLSPAQIFF